MPTYEVEVEPIANAQLTGRLGTATATYRGRDYRIPLGAPGATCNGHPVGLDCIPLAVYRHAQGWYDRLRAEVLARTSDDTGK